MRIVFMGTPDFAVPSLERLVADGHEIAAVFTQPDKPRSRMKRIPSPVKAAALEHGFTVFQPTTVRDEAVLQQVRELHPQLLVVVAYGKILPQALLDIPTVAAINVHSSILPQPRGYKLQGGTYRPSRQAQEHHVGSGHNVGWIVRNASQTPLKRFMRGVHYQPVGPQPGPPCKQAYVVLPQGSHKTGHHMAEVASAADAYLHGCAYWLCVCIQSCDSASTRRSLSDASRTDMRTKFRCSSPVLVLQSLIIMLNLERSTLASSCDVYLPVTSQQK